MKLGTVDITKVQGIGDKFVGLTKEAIGVLVDNDALQRAGQAQQEKATEKLKALADELKADSEQAKADTIGKSTGGSGSGVFAEAKGKAKSAVGGLVGDSDLQDSGDADAERGAAERRATQDRASAKAHESEAAAAGKAQQGADALS